MPAPWVKTGLYPMVGPLPGWVIIPWPYTIFNWASFWGWLPTILLIVLAVWLRKKGRTLMWVVRAVKSRMRGGVIRARTLGYRRVQTTEVPVWNFDLDEWRKL